MTLVAHPRSTISFPYPPHNPSHLVPALPHHSTETGTNDLPSLFKAWHPTTSYHKPDMRPGLLEYTGPRCRRVVQSPVCRRLSEIFASPRIWCVGNRPVAVSSSALGMFLNTPSAGAGTGLSPSRVPRRLEITRDRLLCLTFESWVCSEQTLSCSTAGMPLCIGKKTCTQNDTQATQLQSTPSSASQHFLCRTCGPLPRGLGPPSFWQEGWPTPRIQQLRS
jgi:hypothetical protein